MTPPFSCNLHLQYGNIQRHIAEGIGAAGMDPAELLVGHTAAVALFGDKDLAADETGVAPAALTAAAVGRSTDTGTLAGIQQRLVGAAGGLELLAADDDGQLEGLAGGIGGISGILGGIAELATHFEADAA